MSSRSISDRSFVDPRTLVFWVFVGLTVYSAFHLYPSVVLPITVFPGPGMFATILWLVYGLVLAVIIYKLELFERRSPITIIGAFVWGAVVATSIAITASPALHDLVSNVLGSDKQDWVAAFAAPLLEEPLKMLGVVALAFIPGARINSTVDGLFFGLLVGLGYEVTEGLLYTSQASLEQGGSFTMVFLVFVLRGVVGGLWSHPTFTAFSGAGVGYFFSSKASAAKRWLVMIGSLIVAMILHGFFDSPLFEFNGNNFAASFVKGLPALILLVILVRISRNRERAVFESVAKGAVPADLVSEDELETLLTKSARRKARKQVRKQSGFAAGHALRRLQQAEVELIAAVASDGAGSDIAQRAGQDVTEARQVLQVATTE